MNKTLSAGLAALALVALPQLASAQTVSPATATAAGSSTVTVGQVLYIGVTGADLNFGSVAQSDLDAGYKDVSTPSVITHRGNVAHSVTVTAAANVMTGVGTKARTDKPSTDLRFKLGSAPTATDPLANGLSTTATALHSNAPAGSYVNHESLYYRLMLSYLDTEGTYNLGFTYTVVAQ